MTTRYRFTVTVTTDTPERALRVMSERTGYDEQYEDHQGVEFDYTIDWSIPPGDQYDELARATNAAFYGDEDDEEEP